jgi:hypothetical protein
LQRRSEGHKVPEKLLVFQMLVASYMSFKRVFKSIFKIYMQICAFWLILKHDKSVQLVQYVESSQSSSRESAVDSNSVNSRLAG